MEAKCPYLPPSESWTLSLWVFLRVFYDLNCHMINCHCFLEMPKEMSALDVCLHKGNRKGMCHMPVLYQVPEKGVALTAS